MNLVVIAEKEELDLVEKLGYEKGYPIIITGVGALNVINALKDIPKDTNIINIGYAGSKDLKPGEFYGVRQVSLYHPNVKYFEQSYLLKVPYNYEIDIEDGEYLFSPKRCYTSSDFVVKIEDKNKALYSDCLFDMELAYIMSLGFKNVISIKYVSDNLDLQQYRETVKLGDPDAVIKNAE